MPELLTTMVGSLPFDSIDEAVEYSLSHDIPAVPELPKLDGGMFSYVKDGKMPAAYERFCKAVRDRGIKKVKVQAAGPVTARIHGGMSENEAVNGISRYVTAMLRGLDFVETVYVCFDEPGIEISNRYLPFTRIHDNEIARTRRYIDTPRGINVIQMIHSCNDVSDKIGYFDDFDFKVVSFDAIKYNVKYAGGSLRVEYWDYRRKGGVLCYGAVDIRGGFGVAQFFPSDARDGDMVSSSCGLGNLSTDDCYKTRRILQDIKDALR